MSKLVLDVSPVIFMSSAGTGELMRLIKRARGKGGDLRLANAKKYVHHLVWPFVGSAILLFDSVDEAVESY